MERLRIEYKTGYMELNIEAFFPCKMPTARKAARLINQYCSDETRTVLLWELQEMADRDCFANRRGVCTCLKDNDFGGRDCSFYKTADTAQKEQHGKKDGGAFHGNRKV